MASSGDFGEWASVVNEWLKSVIIGQNICPFAKDQFHDGEVDSFFFQGSDHKDALTFSFDKIEEFSKTERRSFLIVYPDFKDNFIQFYNFSALIEDEVHHKGFQDKIQVVTFHPQFRFEGEKPSARGNYVNRSPYPLIHFLDFSQVREIVEKHGEKIGEEISQNNNQKLNGFTPDEFQAKIAQYIDGFWRP